MIYTKKILGSVIVGAAIAASVPTFADESRDYDLSSFNEVSVSAGIDATITVGDKQQVRIETRRKSTLRKIKVDVVGNKLVVTRRGNFSDWFSFGQRDIKLTVSMPDLSDIAASAGAEVSVSGDYGTVLTGSASSGASLELLDITADKVKLRASSGAEIYAEGACATLKANSSSGADLSARKLECVEVDVSANSGAEAEVFASDTLDANASSGGNIEVFGDPESRDVSESFGGDVDFD